MAFSLASSFSLLVRHSSLHMLCSASTALGDTKPGSTVYPHACARQQAVAMEHVQAALTEACEPMHKPTGWESQPRCLMLQQQWFTSTGHAARQASTALMPTFIFHLHGGEPELEGLTSSKPAFLSLVQSAKASADGKG